MIDKLKEIIEHHNSLESEMVNPDILNDKNRYTEITKEYHHLNHIVEKSKNYVSLYFLIIFLAREARRKFKLQGIV